MSGTTIAILAGLWLAGELVAWVRGAKQAAEASSPSAPATMTEAQKFADICQLNTKLKSLGVDQQTRANLLNSHLLGLLNDSPAPSQP